MLEKLNTPGHETISVPNNVAIEQVAEIMKKKQAPRIAEIGTGVGATSLALAKQLNQHGELHLFDFADRTSEIKADLERLGYSNVRAFGNTRKHWDSYCWSLMKLIKEEPTLRYDFVFLDGAHTFHHDALAFLLCDKILADGGVIHFDDFFWRYADSPSTAQTRDVRMTKEQIDSYQIQLVISTFVDPNPQYTCVVPNKVWKKTLRTYGTAV